eukprot:TRINITY_DN8494_c0_g3_i4.p1 TRINITY_DN8494_c0_g3~~TRINITY_DN8494_c0_g3_i4.p1  ORF type:complete len:258 (-),score=36.74 TRINITY_DN8494_c0_g3_i4:197-970(-)
MLPGRRRKECKAQWLKTQHIKINKSSWPETENEQLIQIVKKFGTSDWTVIADEFNKVSTGRIRTRKQCRDHWLNFLNPDVNKSKITPTDELHLICYWQQLGNKWVEIAKFMGRSENWVKNNWKKIFRREGLSPHEDTSEHIPGLIEKLKENALNYKRDTMTESVQSESVPYDHTTEEMKDVRKRKHEKSGWMQSSEGNMEDVESFRQEDGLEVPDEYGSMESSSEGRGIGSVIRTGEQRVPSLLSSGYSFQGCDSNG